MVPAEDNDGIVIQPASLQCVQKPADAVIHVADSAIVCPPSPLNLLITELDVPEIADLKKALAVGVLLLLGYFHFGQLNVHTIVHVPVLLLDGVGVVGVRQGDLEYDVGSASIIHVRNTRTCGRSTLQNGCCGGGQVGVEVGVGCPGHYACRVTQADAHHKWNVPSSRMDGRLGPPAHGRT